MKLIGYPTAGKAPWPLLDYSDVEFCTREDKIENLRSRGFNYTEELVSLCWEASVVNSMVIELHCRHERTKHLSQRCEKLWKQAHSLASDLNPPIYEVGDDVEYRMFPHDPPQIARVVRNDHFDMTNGRCYGLYFPDEPTLHVCGVHAENLHPIGVRNIESEIATAQALVNSATADFHHLGPWRNQKSSYQRQHWQRAKLAVARAEHKLHHLLAEAKRPQPKLLPCTSSASNTNGQPTENNTPEPPSAPASVAIPFDEPSVARTPTSESSEPIEFVQSYLL